MPYGTQVTEIELVDPAGDGVVMNGVYGAGSIPGTLIATQGYVEAYNPATDTLIFRASAAANVTIRVNTTNPVGRTNHFVTALAVVSDVLHVPVGTLDAVVFKQTNGELHFDVSAACRVTVIRGPAA